MAQGCEVCGKGPQFGNNISHAHNVTKRRWNVNLRPVKAKVNGGAKRLRVCTTCIKGVKVERAYLADSSATHRSPGQSGAFCILENHARRSAEPGCHPPAMDHHRM